MLGDLQHGVIFQDCPRKNILGINLEAPFVGPALQAPHED